METPGRVGQGEGRRSLADAACPGGGVHTAAT
jgi:hypothetical protein